MTEWTFTRMTNAEAERDGAMDSLKFSAKHHGGEDRVTVYRYRPTGAVTFTADLGGRGLNLSEEDTARLVAFIQTGYPEEPADG